VKTRQGGRLFASDRTDPTVYWSILAVAFLVTLRGVFSVRRLLSTDSLFYYGRALLYSGYSREEAFAKANEAGDTIGFNVPSVERMFDWNLVEPRVVYSLLSAPFVRLMGWHGLLVVSIGAVALLFGLMGWALRRRYGTVVGLAVMSLVLSSGTWFFFGVAALTESLSALWFALALGAAWRARAAGGRRRRAWLLAAGVVTVLFAFTRQAMLIPAGALFAAWLGEWAKTKTPKNSWAGPAAVIVGVAAACQVFQLLAFPYSPKAEWLVQTGSDTWTLKQSLFNGLRAVYLSLTAFSGSDAAMAVLIVLLAASFAVCWRRVEVHLAAGALAAGMVYQILNGAAQVRLRYCQPGWFAYVLAVGALLGWLATRPRAAATRIARPAPAAKASEPASTGARRAWREWAPVALPAGVAAGFSTFTYFFPAANGSYGYQAGIAAGIGWRLNQGETLYLDVWENKGPLYYLINALGVRLDYWHGVYVLELIALVAGAVLMYRLARMLLNPWLASVAATVALTQLAKTLVGGDLVEEWAIPLQALAALAAFRAVTEMGTRPVRRGLALGLTIGGLFALRPNLVAFAGVAALGLALYLAKSRAWSRLWRLAGTALAACAAVLGALGVWLAADGALGAALEAAYFDVVHWQHSPEELEASSWKMLGFASPAVLMALGLFGLGVAGLVVRRFWRQVEGGDTRAVALTAPVRWTALVCAAGLAANWLANRVSGNPDPNYMMSFVPLMAWPVAWLIAKAVQGLNQGLGLRPPWPGLIAALSGMVLVAASAGPAVAGRDKIWSDSASSESVRDLTAFVREHTDPDDEIALFGVSPTVYYAAQRAPGTARLYEPMSRFDADFKRRWCDSRAEEVLAGRPKLVILGYEDSSSGWTAGCVSPDLANKVRAMLDRDYEAADNDHGWAAYLRR
jgi:hypothetical protein